MENVGIQWENGGGGGGEMVMGTRGENRFSTWACVSFRGRNARKLSSPLPPPVHRGDLVTHYCVTNKIPATPGPPSYRGPSARARVKDARNAETAVMCKHARQICYTSRHR